MRILAVADIESAYLWDYFRKETLSDVELILSAGDLKPEYLSFLATMKTVPVLYVHGNQDRKNGEKPEGCIPIDDEIYVYKNIRVLGLGGSMLYNGGKYQYSEESMARRIAKLERKIKRYGGFDILLTHSPAYKVNDGTDLPHTGFKCFHELIEKYSPRFFVHGHYHKTYTSHFKQFDKIGQTCVINAYEKCFFDY